MSCWALECGQCLLRGQAARRPDSASLKPKAGAGPKKGMQLGKARKANDFLESLRAEGEVIQVGCAGTCMHMPPLANLQAPCSLLSTFTPISLGVCLKACLGVPDGEPAGWHAKRLVDLQCCERDATLPCSVGKGCLLRLSMLLLGQPVVQVLSLSGRHADGVEHAARRWTTARPRPAALRRRRPWRRPSPGSPSRCC